MSKLLSVAQLRAGDRFEFVAIGDKFAGSQAKDSAHMMIVANEPKVNRAANSCFFRYKAEAEPIESRSFNGTAEIEVRVFTEHAPLAAAPPTPPPAPAALKPEVAHASNGHTPATKAAADPIAAILAAAPVVEEVADSEPEAIVDESTEEESAPAKPARKKAATKTAIVKKTTKVAPEKASAVKAPAVKKKPAKAAAVKTTATKKAAKPAAKKKA